VKTLQFSAVTFFACDLTHGQRTTQLPEAIIAAALEVHRGLGPGLLGQAYEACLACELAVRGFNIERQKALPLTYKNNALDLVGYRVDLLVEGAGGGGS